MISRTGDYVHGKRILLIIGGGIAAYKCLDLIRRLAERGADVRAIMTPAAEQFVTKLSVGALTGERVYCELFDLDDENEIGHIGLSRQADAIIVAPATADLMAKMANGLAGDLATAVLLATDLPVLIAPAMNPRMWQHPATQRNVSLLHKDGIRFVGPNVGEMAERNESGPGRMSEPLEIVAALDKLFAAAGAGGPADILSGRHVLVTSGPTHEPIDPVRYIANRSSGKQGYAIARAAAELGATVTLVSGPTALAAPAGVTFVPVETALQMRDAALAALPADIAICAAAVADWRVAEAATQKLKKGRAKSLPRLELTENPDILKAIATHKQHRPQLVIGFAAETENIVAHGSAKLKTKGCDWIVANDVSDSSGVMGGDRNTVHIITASGVESWAQLDKYEVSRRLIQRASDTLSSDRTAAE